jgi:hypothetical protein
MTISKSINWQTSKDNKSLLSLNLPEPPTPAEPTLKIWPYVLNQSEALELRDALNSALDYLAIFMTQPPEKEARV